MIAAGASAAVLIGSALFNRGSARRAERKTPPRGSFVEVDGVRLHYYDRGSGPPVVLLHGNGVMLQDFEVSGVLDLAAERNRVIAFDTPGFGHSDRPRSTVWTPTAQARLIAMALQKIGIQSVVVVGHSWGTMVALAMALDHPELVDGLVLLSGYYFGSVRLDVPPAALPAIPILGDVMAHTVSPLAGRLMAPAALYASFAPAPVPEQDRRLPLGMLVRPTQVRATAADAALMVPAAVALSRRYHELAAPVIVMAGEGDRIVDPAGQAQRFANQVENAEMRSVPDQGHMFHYAVPGQVVAAVIDVLARAEVRS